MNRSCRPERTALSTALLLSSALFAGTAASAQASGADAARELDLNSYYAYPVAVGAGYAGYSGFSSFASGFRFTDLSTELRLPLPKAPGLQPLARAGMITATESGAAATGQWNHSLYYGQLGIGLARRFAKNFEIGGDFLAGAGQSSFPSLVSGGAVGSVEILGSASARIALVPSFNFSLEIAPGLSYRRTLGPLTEFNGLSYGIGFLAVWRFGDDPDAPVRALRSLRVGQTKLPAVFAAMQGYYSRNPIGSVALTNTERSPLTELEISFFQPGYMDSPTPVASIPSLAPGETVQVGVIASYNQEIFRTEGMTPLAGQLIARYRVKGKPVEQAQSLSYDLYDKTSVTWDDDRKVGAFVTPADTALRNYVSFIRQALKQETLAQLNAPLQTAAQVYSALQRLGILYQADPTSPFTRAQDDRQLVDSINVGRETLSRGTGDCDDLTVLFASLLETAGIETGYITVPGHIYPAFNTKIPSASFRELHPDRSLGIAVEGSLWVPIEITLVGKQGFVDAWRRGAELWRLYDQDPGKRRFTRTAEAQALFGPVALKESDLGLQYGAREDLAQAYRDEITRLADSSIADLAASAKASGDKRDLNLLGLANVRFGRLKDAEAAFSKAVKLDPGMASAQVNLGNIAFLQKDYKKALAQYQAASSALASQGRADSPAAQMVFVNLSKAYSALLAFPEARTAFAKAESIDPERVREFAYLAQVGAGGGGKAAEQSLDPLFLGEP